MKKACMVIIITISLTLSLFVPSFATDTNTDNAVIDSSIEFIELDDGGYITVELITMNYRSVTLASAYTKSGSKFVTRYTSDDEIVWRYTLTGTFSVENGVQAVCTNSTYSTEDNDSAWSFSDCSATKSGNEAFGVATVERKRLFFIVVETVDIDISIVCDVNGNLS